MVLALLLKRASILNNIQAVQTSDTAWESRILVAIQNALYFFTPRWPVMILLPVERHMYFVSFVKFWRMVSFPMRDPSSKLPLESPVSKSNRQTRILISGWMLRLLPTRLSCPQNCGFSWTR